jgi:hypothetical protein
MLANYQRCWHTAAQEAAWAQAHRHRERLHKRSTTSTDNFNCWHIKHSINVMLKDQRYSPLSTSADERLSWGNMASPRGALCLPWTSNQLTAICTTTAHNHQHHPSTTCKQILLSLSHAQRVCGCAPWQNPCGAFLHCSIQVVPRSGSRGLDSSSHIQCEVELKCCY